MDINSTRDALINGSTEILWKKINLHLYCEVQVNSIQIISKGRRRRLTIVPVIYFHALLCDHVYRTGTHLCVLKWRFGSEWKLMIKFYSYEVQRALRCLHGWFVPQENGNKYCKIFFAEL